MEHARRREILSFFKKNDPLLYPHVRVHYETVAHAQKKKSDKKLFESLASSVVSQQLSLRAADTIWMRLQSACCGVVTPASILSHQEEALRACGLSRAKVKTLQELSRAVIEKRLVFKKIRTIPEEEAILALSTVWGIGRWTAEMFLMFALERENVFSVGDLGLKRSMESLYSLPKDSDSRVYENIAAAWAPHKTIASRVLWKVRDTTNTK